jgi:hypothetical protein
MTMHKEVKVFTPGHTLHHYLDDWEIFALKFMLLPTVLKEVEFT